MTFNADALTKYVPFTSELPSLAITPCVAPTLDHMPSTEATNWHQQARPIAVLLVPTSPSVLVAWPADLDELVQRDLTAEYMLLTPSCPSLKKHGRSRGIVYCDFIRRTEHHDVIITYCGLLEFLCGINHQRQRLATD